MIRITRRLSCTVTISVRASPVSPEDFRVLNGTSLVHCGQQGPGTVAVGSIKDVEPGVITLSKNDSVLVVGSKGGAWSGTMTASATAALKLPQSLAPEDAAMLPAVLAAVTILKKHGGKLKAGDTIIQSAKDSAIGRALLYVAKAKGLNVLSVPDGVDSKDVALQAAGKVKLAVAQTAGSTVLALSRSLAHGGVLVCVHGANEPLTSTTRGVQVPVSPLIFSNVSIVGWDFSLWMSSATDEEKQGALAEALSLGKGTLGELRSSATFASSEWKRALASVEKTSQPAVLLF